MSDTIDIGTVIAAHLRSLGSQPVDAGHLTRVVDGAFFTIPRTEITDVDHEYVVPRDLAEDAPAIEGYHAHRLVQAIAESIRDGWIVVEMPTRHEMPPERYDPPDMVRFKLTARARRIPSHEGLEIASRSGE
jgi:hypothetical protein